MGLFPAFSNYPDMITVYKAIRTATHTTKSPGITWKFKGNKAPHVCIVPLNHLAQLNQNITIAQTMLETDFFLYFLFFFFLNLKK